eukprot:COSAG01_NODE_71962_length_254_cov_0.851613_1_plen_32_part_01
MPAARRPPRVRAAYIYRVLAMHVRAARAHARA